MKIFSVVPTREKYYRICHSYQVFNDYFSMKIWEGEKVAFPFIQ
jgi:hypothetical protein